jgi:hypothetical protein
LDFLPDALIQRSDLPVEGAHVAHQLGGQPLADPSRFVTGPGSSQQLGGVRREPLGDAVREEVAQQDVQAVQSTGTLGMFDIGRYAWIVALVTAAGALYRAGAPRLPLVLLALPAFFVTFDHAFPFGSLTFGTFFVVAVWLELAPGRLTLAGQPRRVS